MQDSVWNTTLPLTSKSDCKKRLKQILRNRDFRSLDHLESELVTPWVGRKITPQSDSRLDVYIQTLYRHFEEVQYEADVEYLRDKLIRVLETSDEMTDQWKLRDVRAAVWVDVDQRLVV